ncbi:M56 family metallopeptidase [Kordiimonas aquimaris]|uniref:M56 family metallopeptidase n=1 Tax=Kordiimonas aquimaris TaxID=707591 RepID=UPI0021D20511|nr:M56 family metallopeptidase [Kordiimonas aquimaris]
MMIKALILVHLWSFVVAVGAWLLQRDVDERIGIRFPSSNVWLTLVILCFLPGVLYLMPIGTVVGFPDIEIPELITAPISESTAGSSESLDYLSIYLGIGILLMCRTLWRWSRLQSLALAPTIEPDVFTTTSKVPPLTLSWPRKVIVIPQGFQTQSALIRHERAHLYYNDAELTLFLLLLQDMMLRTPGVSYLVRQWRLAIELRADHAATKTLTPSERKDYATLLLNGLRSVGDEEVTLPYPTAKLGSTRHRSVKMRLAEIIENKPRVRQRRWGTALLCTSIGASAIGLMSAAASVNKVIDIAYDQVAYVKQTSWRLPASCPGFNEEDVKTELKELTVNGQLVSQHIMSLGIVVVTHDVRRDGQTKNLQVSYSTHSCFEEEAKAAVAQWVTEPQEIEIRNAAVKVHFTISGDTLEELNPQLSEFLQ